MDFVKAFLIGGLICALVQILMLTFGTCTIYMAIK